MSAPGEALAEPRTAVREGRSQGPKGASERAVEARRSGACLPGPTQGRRSEGRGGARLSEADNAGSGMNRWNKEAET
jgi:hypothetical protein